MKHPVKSMSILFACFLFSFTVLCQAPELIPYRKGNKWGFANNQKKIVIPVSYDSAAPFSEGMAAVRMGIKWGFIDASGNEKVAPAYTSVQAFRKGKAIVTKETYMRKQGVIDKNGNIITELKYEIIFPYTQTQRWTKTRVGKLTGLLDSTGKELIPPKYTYIGDLKEGLARVELDGKHGFIDSLGKERVMLKYEKANNFSEGMAAVMAKGYFDTYEKWFFIDIDGRRISNIDYAVVQDFSEGHAIVYARNTGVELIDKTGKASPAPKEVHWGKELKDGFIICSVEDAASALATAGMSDIQKYFSAKYLYGTTDRSGTIIIPAIYEKLERIGPSLLAVKKDGKWGCISNTGKPVGAMKYDTLVFEANPDVLLVSANNKWGILGLNGKEVVSPKYDSIGKFYEKIAVIKHKGLYGYINTAGKEITAPKYQYTFSFWQGAGCIWQDNKCGFVNSTGKEVVAPKYDGRRYAEIFRNTDQTPISYSVYSGIAYVRLNGKWGYIDMTGKEYFED